MARHMDNIIRDVSKYWKDHVKELTGPGNSEEIPTICGRDA
jgi:hypothetical protein